MATTSRWRIAARQAINQCLIAEKPTTAAEFRKAVKPYYPFGEREYHPYKMWLSEVKKTAEEIEATPPPADLRNYWTNPPLKKG